MRPKTICLARGLTVLGLASWWATATVADGPASAPPPAAVPAPPAPPSVLLLTTGRVVQGTIIETDDGYEVRTKIGPLPFKRRQVERAFGSLGEVYTYKVQQLPAGDTDERMKLARWCLEQKLFPEAQEQLEAVLAGVPDYGPAKAMLFQLRAATRGAATSDQAVMRTGGEQPVEPPGTLSLAELRDARNASPRGAGLPVIFDLPPPLAVKRFQEFAVFVHPALQRRCAECHHETSNLSFQLIRARTRRDLENDLLVRANLDAVLRLVDPRDPARSKLLSAAVMPHKPTGRPILTGPNDPTYGQIARWLEGVRSPAAAGGSPAPVQSDAGAVVPARFAVPGESAPPPGGGFAADRGGATAPAPAPSGAPTAASQAIGPPRRHATFGPLPPPAEIDAPDAVRLPGGETVPAAPAPAGQVLPGSAVGTARVAPPPAAFRPPPLPGAGSSQAAPARPAANAPGDPARKTVHVPGVGEVEVVDLDEAPPAPAKTKKAPRIKADALQKFMSGTQR